MAEEIRRDGGEAAALAGDVTADDFPGRCVKAAVDAFGTIDHPGQQRGCAAPCCPAEMPAPVVPCLHSACRPPLSNVFIAVTVPHLLVQIVQSVEIWDAWQSVCWMRTWLASSSALQAVLQQLDDSMAVWTQASHGTA